MQVAGKKHNIAQWQVHSRALWHMNAPLFLENWPYFNEVKERLRNVETKLRKENKILFQSNLISLLGHDSSADI